MRGWPSSSEEDCSASCARSVTRCSDNRRMSSELRMSEDSIGSPERSMSRMSLRPRLGVGFLRAGGGDLRRDVAELLGRQRGVVGADEQIGFAAEVRDLGLGVGDALLHRFDLAGQPLPGSLRLFPLGAALPHQIGVGDGISDPRGESGILGEEIDDDDAGFLDRIDGEPVVIGFQHALLWRHAPRVFDKSKRAEHDLDRGEPGEHRIEFRAFAELELFDHLAGEVARQHKLHLAGHRFLVDGAAVGNILIGFRPQEHVAVLLDEEPRLGLVFRWNDLHHAERDERDQNRRAEDRPFPAPQHCAERRQVELRIARRSIVRRPTVQRTMACGPSQLRRYAHDAQLLPPPSNARSDDKLLRLPFR